MSVEIAARALNAFAARQQVTAHNIANSSTQGFVPQRVDLEEDQTGGVQARLHEASQVPKPSSPLQDPPPSSTDLTQEMITMMATERAYDANAVMLSSQATLQGRLINELV